MFYFFPLFVLLSLFKSFPSVFCCVKQIFLVFEENTLQYLKKIQTKRLLRKFLGSLTQRAHHETLLNFVSSFSTIAHGIFETNSSFRVKWRTAGKVGFLFFKGFPLALAKLSFWWGCWALGYHSMEFRHFRDIS